MVTETLRQRWEGLISLDLIQLNFKHYSRNPLISAHVLLRTNMLIRLPTFLKSEMDINMYIYKCYCHLIINIEYICGGDAVCTIVSYTYKQGKDILITTNITHKTITAYLDC